MANKKVNPKNAANPLKPKPSTETSHQTLKAVVAYRPRIDTGNTAQMEEVIPFIACRTSLNEGTISMVLKELRDTLFFYLRSGRPVKLEDLGTFSMDLAADGTFQLKFRPTVKIKNLLNSPAWFTGDIKNKDMTGKTTEDYVQRWNDEHPDDPITT